MAPARARAGAAEEHKYYNKSHLGQSALTEEISRESSLNTSQFHILKEIRK